MAKLQLDAKGLVLAPGELSRAPGALIQADNVNIEAPGVIRSRNGFAKQTNAVGGAGHKLINTQELASNLLYNYGAATATALKYGDGSASWTAVGGTVTNQPATKMQCAVSKRNHYLTSDEGVRRMETDFSLAFAGMPKGLALDLTGPTVLTGTGGILADTSSVAYRVTWCKKDQQGRIMEGAPSSRTVVYNNTRTSGWAVGVAKNIVARVLLPQQVLTASTVLTTSYFFRLYRSEVEATGITPSDDMRLVYEAFLAAGDITNGYVDVTDSTVDTLRVLAPTLYTNPNDGGEDGVGGPGIDQSNQPPPRSRDTVLFGECLFYSDLRYPGVLELTLLSTVAGTGITAADTLTIGGIVYTAIAPGAPANNQFVVHTVAAGSALVEALERTLMCLTECINKSTTNTTTWAYYVQGVEGDLPKIRLEQRTITSTITAVASAHGTAFRPSIATAVSFRQDTFSNAFTFSKPAQGDAVPYVNIGFIGRDDTSLLRMIPLRNSLYLFTDSGIYRLTGDDFNTFAVQEFDLTFHLIGREMITCCDDAIFAWGYEGIAMITAAGVQYISNAIEPVLQSAINTLGLTAIINYSWAAAYRSKHRVMFSVPDSNANNVSNSPTLLIYDTRMQAWSKWQFKVGGDVNRTQGHSCGAVRVSDDLLFMGQWNNGGDTKVYKERRTYAAADYQDDLYDSSGTAIAKTVVWSAVAGDPTMSTHWDELHLFWDVSPTFSAFTTPTALTAQYTADLASASNSVAVAPTAASRMSRTLIEREQRRSVRMQVSVIHTVAQEYFGLTGMALTHLPPESTRTVRT